MGMTYRILRVRVGAFICMFMLSNCSSYSTKFQCGDGRGWPCYMLADVDNKISNGEINSIYEKHNSLKTKCRCAKGKGNIYPTHLRLNNNSPVKVLINTNKASNGCEAKYEYLYLR